MDHSFTVGHTVTIQTTLGEEICATVYAWDQGTNMLLLKEAGAHNGVATLRLVNGACVAETLLDQPPTAPIDTEVPFIDKERLKKRAERALRQAEREYDRVSEGVSKEAQAIFEAISKTLPCRWQDMTTIVVLDEVLVPEPYTVSSCTTQGRTLTNPKALDRVRLIVREARARLRLRGLTQDDDTT